MKHKQGGLVRVCRESYMMLPAIKQRIVRERVITAKAFRTRQSFYTMLDRDRAVMSESDVELIKQSFACVGVKAPFKLKSNEREID